jgi:hypothetical protein
MSRLAIVIATLLVAATAQAVEPVVLDSFDDVAHRLTSTQQDRVQIDQLPSAELPFGVNGARLQWTFPAANTWILNHAITRRHETPLDLSEADAITAGFRVPQPNRALAIAFHLVDTSGAQLRFVDYPTFESTLTNWETRRYPLADFEKSRWYSNGRAVNLAAINEIVYRLINDSATEPGTFSFDISRVEATRNGAMLHQLMLEDFEQGVGNWSDSAGGQAREAAGRDGTALALTTSGTTATRFFRRLARPLDLRTARYARVTLKGDPALNGANPIVGIILEDAAGNRAIGRIEQWAGREAWAEMHLPFRADAIEHYTADSASALSMSGASCWREEYRPGPRHAERTNLATITAIGVSIETATGAEGTVLVDNLRIGFYSGADAATAERDLRAAATPTPLAVRWQAATVPLATQIRDAAKPALLYVRQPTNNRCRELESTLLVSQGFVFRTHGFLTFFEDTSRSQAIAREQNILRVPTIILFDREGKERNRFEVDIDDLTLYRAMDALR